jgi:hypothetical protein
MKNIKRPKDTNQLGKLIVDLATGKITETPQPDNTKNPNAVALGSNAVNLRNNWIFLNCKL